MTATITGNIKANSITYSNTFTASMKYPVWQNVGYTTGIDSISLKPVRKKPRPYKYLIATDNKNDSRYKVQWRLRHPNHEVWVGLTLIGETFKHSDGYWTCVDRFGKMAGRGFANRKMASMHLLDGHYQFTPSLETANDFNKQP